MTSDSSSVIDALPELVSVVMPVRNAADVVGEEVAALLAQSYEAEWELIVVDNGSTDGSDDVVRAQLAGSDAPPQLVRAEVLRFTERFGHASPRNHGAAISRGSWLAFCDADDVVAPDWLAKLVSSRQPGTITASLVVALSDSDPWYPERSGVDRPLPEMFGVPVVHTGGMLVCRTDFESLGGFDVKFDRGGADVDFSIRAFAAGMQSAIAPSARYRVRSRPTSGSAAAQSYRYGRSRVRLFARHCDVVPEPPSDWMLILRRLRDVVRRSPDLFSSTKRVPYVRMVSNITARLIWSARLRVRYF